MLKKIECWFWFLFIYFVCVCVCRVTGGIKFSIYINGRFKKFLLCAVHVVFGVYALGVQTWIQRQKICCNSCIYHHDHSHLGRDIRTYTLIRYKMTCIVYMFVCFIRDSLSSTYAYYTDRISSHRQSCGKNLNNTRNF